MAGRTMRSILLVGAPIVAVLTLMLGLRVGASHAVRAASVFAAPPARAPAAGAPAPFVLQVLTYYEERGVRETVATKALTVVARSKGKEARWSGDSNEDGIAEANLSIEGLAKGDPLEVEVRAAGDPQPLAAGSVEWHDVTWARFAPEDDGHAAGRPAKRVGAIALDVLVEGERLVPGFETTLWVHATPAARGTTIDVAPEPGLATTKEHVVTCDGGWAELPVIAQSHVVGIGLTAHAGDATGEWFGPLPVAPGAFFVQMPRVVQERETAHVVLVAPNPRHVVYAEVDDESGRVVAAALPLERDAEDAVPRARFEIPPLAKGLHWLVVSGEPRGAERLAGAAIAKPFFVGEPPVGSSACAIGPWLAKRPAEGFPRWLAVDGMAVRGTANRARHRTGLFIGLLALFAAAVLDTLLLIAAAREARAVMLLAELDEPDLERGRVVARPPGGGLAIALCIAVLGFALLAVLLFLKA